MATFRGLYNSNPTVTGDEIIGEDFRADLLGETTSGTWASQGVKLKSVIPSLRPKYNAGEQLAYTHYAFHPSVIADPTKWPSVNMLASLASSKGYIGLALADAYPSMKLNLGVGDTKTINGELLSLVADNKYIFAHVFKQVSTGNATCVFDLGDGGTGSAGAGVQIATPLSYLTFDAANYFTYAASTELSGSSAGAGQTVCVIVTLDLTTGSEASVKYAYGTIDGAATPINGVLTSPSYTPPYSLASLWASPDATVEHTYGVYAWRFATDDLPNASAISAAAVSMAENPEDGSYIGFAAYS